VVFGVLLAWGARVALPSAGSPSPRQRALVVRPVLRGVVVDGLRRSFETLDAALAAAPDGATITLVSGRTFRTGPLDLRGKALTVRAAHGVRPCLEPAPGHSWEALLTGDRDLRLDGLDLCAPPEGEGRPLVCVEGGVLRLRDCRLRSPHRAPLVVLRRGAAAYLRDCRLDAEAVAVSAEVGGRPCRLELKKCSLRVGADSGVALSLWSGEEEEAVGVEVELADNACSCGRVLALRAVPGPVRVRAAGNELNFREALISYDGYRDPAAARRGTSWQEGGNRHRPSGPWVRVNGRAVPGANLRQALR
jgi:hypothetical protein